MKKALMIAYQFPPMGGSGVQRTIKFVKYMMDFNWEPVVFTRKVSKMTLKDETLSKDIPSNVKIIRTNAYDLTEIPSLFGLLGKAIARKILIPDGERLWQTFSKEEAAKAVKEEKIDLIYTTSYPYSDHLLGLYLKKKFPNIPWVVDFRDEWTNNPYLLDNPYNPLRMNIERKMEKRVMKAADYLITNTPIMMKNFVDTYPFTKEKFYVIPNGYDKDDFQGLERGNVKNDKFTITYSGSLYGRRKPDTFFEALKQLIDDKSIDSNKIRVQLIGNYIVKKLQEKIDKYGLNKVVEIIPYMEHRESIKELLNSDALLLIIGAGPGAEAFYTGKVFEYIRTGIPILALVPEKGVAAEVIRETNTDLIADSRDVEKIKNNILTCYSSWLRNDFTIKPNWDKIKRFERRELTKELVKIFNMAIKKDL